MLRLPIAHAEGRYQADEATLAAARGEGARGLPLRPAAAPDARLPANPNGSLHDIAGLYGGPRRNVLGLMPHPERMRRAHPRRHRRPPLFHPPCAPPSRAGGPVPPTAMSREPAVTPELAREHGLTDDEYAIALKATRPHADLHRARGAVGDVVRALLVQVVARPPEAAAHQGAAGDPGPGRERRRGRHRRRLGGGLQDGVAQPPVASSSPTRARRRASAASCATCSPWARARSP